MRRDMRISRISIVIVAAMVLSAISGCAAMLPSYSSASTTPANARLGGNYSTRSVGGRTVHIKITMPEKTP